MKPPSSARLIRGHRLAQGLVGCWLMNEGGESTQVFDLSENGNHGVPSNTVWTWTFGKYGSAIKVVETGAAIAVGSRCLATFTHYTIESRVKLTALVDYNGIYKRSQSYTTSGTTNIEVFVNSGGRIYVYHDRGGSANIGYTGINAVAAGVSTHIVVTWNGSVWAFYVNGVLISHSISGTPVNPPTGQPSFICHGASNDSLHGDCEWMRIYDNAKTASEIALLHREPFCMVERKARTALMSGYAVPLVGNAGIMTTNTGFWGPTF